MTRGWMIVGFLAFIAVYHTVGQIFGREAKVWFLIGLLVVSALLSLILFLVNGHLLGGGSGGSAGPGRDSDEVEDIFPLPGPRLRGFRNHVDSALGIVAAFGPAVLVSLWRGDPLSPDACLTGYHFLAMVGGVALYCVIRPWIWRA